MKTIYIDTIKKRARETWTNLDGKKEDLYLIFQAPGAEPGSVRHREHVNLLFGFETDLLFTACNGRIHISRHQSLLSRLYS